VTQEEFRFYLGSLALNFSATVGHRLAQPIERIATADDLARWLRAADLVAGDVVPSAAEYRAAIRLREAIYAVGAAVIHDRTPAIEDVETINRAASAERRIAQLDALARTRMFRKARAPVRAALAAIADDAIRVFNEECELLGACEDRACGALMRANPRGPRRRWCSMASCGNRAKVAAYRARGVG
jgi:predicted RNA-binding Zn ribbon-like protein